MSSQPTAKKPQSQIQLPFSKAWQISVKNIKIRLGRSIITAGGILLGIAFFSSVRSANLFDAGKVDPAAAHRQQWLAIMALLVCFVGIMNSMLMSVSERFREIGTMKCLGAIDRFIVTIFFIEAALMGTIASFLGWFLGWGIIVLLHLFSNGFRIFTGDFLIGTVIQCVETLVIGLGITLVAAIPPARHAAQMPPAMALRTEV